MATVAQIKRELARLGVQPPKKMNKAELGKLLAHAQKSQSTSDAVINRPSASLSPKVHTPDDGKASPIYDKPKIKCEKTGISTSIPTSRQAVKEHPSSGGTDWVDPNWG